MLSLEEIVGIGALVVATPILIWSSYKIWQGFEMNKIDLLLREKYKLSSDAATIFYSDNRFIEELRNTKVYFAKAYKNDVLSRCVKTTPIKIIPLQ